MPHIATRLLDQSKATVLSGTDNADQMFFSPDSQWIGFFADSKLKKVSVLGGAPTTLCVTGPSPRGASWGEDGNIIANLDNSRLARVPEAGGPPVDVAKPGERKMRTYRWPQVLPGARSVLFISSPTTDYEDANIEAMDLKTGQVKTIHRGGYFARYLSSGHLLYVHQNTLFAAAFDLGSLQLRGAPQPVFEDVGRAGQGAARLTFSDTGTLIYLTANSSADSKGVFAWMDSSGKTVPIASLQAESLTPQLSPDGKGLAYSSAGDIWIYDLDRSLPTRLTLSSQLNRYPVWARDGKHLIYGDEVAHKIWWAPADGAGRPVELLAGPSSLSPTSLSPDGRILAYSQPNTNGGIDIWLLPIDTSDVAHPAPGKPQPLIGGPRVQSPAASIQGSAAFSPDGRWIAYHSNEAGSYQVYVRPFPDTASGGRWQISPNGGQFPRWSQDGRELFYLAPDDRIIAVPYTAKGAAFSRENERVWSPAPILRTGRFRPFDIAPDGQRVVMMPKAAASEQSAVSSVHANVILNFGDELKRRVR